MSDAGDTTLRAPKVTRRAALSPVWLAPLLALAIAGAVAWRYYAALGPTVEIALEAGGGVAAGATAVRYRGVDIGLVEEVRLAPDLDGVVAVARLDPSVEPRLTEATTFWVVRPVVSAGQVEGLDTLLSGVYLGVAFGDGGAPVRRFEALAAPPLTPPGAAGQRITLRAPAGAALSPGAPVYFKSIEVGQVEARHLADDAGSVLFDIFVNAPHDARITPQTRFWDVSGFNASFDANGLSLKVESLVSILRGGVAFDAIDGAVGVADGAVRTLYGSREAAEGSVFEAEPHRQLRYSIAFRQSVRGLAIGAPVEYRGVQIGEVESLAIAPGRVAEETQIIATLVLQPRRLGLDDPDPEALRAYFDRSVARGLRARLASASLVTGALYVEFVDLADAGPGAIDYDHPVPRLPAVPRELDEIRAQVQGLLDRAQELPIEALIGQAIAALEAVTTLVSNPALNRAPAELEGTLAAARGLVEDLEEAEAATELAGAVRSAGAAAAALEAASADLPALAERLNRLAATLQETARSYGAESAVNREAIAALREVRQAARSVATLAQTLERRPNSLILGR
jgi:paraquat-inducible protein B